MFYQYLSTTLYTNFKTTKKAILIQFDDYLLIGTIIIIIR